MNDFKILKHHAQVKDALCKAINNNDVNMVKHLFSTETILKQCPEGYLNLALEEGNVDIIAILLAHGGYDNKKSLFPSLYKVLDLKNNLEVIALLLSHGVNLNEVDSEDCTILHYAVWQWDKKKEDPIPNRYVLIKKLLEGGADVNVQGDPCCCMEGYTPLHVAALWNGGDPKTVALLLEYNPDITIKSTEGQTVLEACHVDRNPEIMQLLTVYKNRILS